MKIIVGRSRIVGQVNKNATQRRLDRETERFPQLKKDL